MNTLKTNSQVLKSIQLKILTTFSFLLFAFLAVGQEVVIKGVVLDAHSKEPVPFADVYLLSNTSKGVTADFDGLFEIKFETAPDVLGVSALGYEVLEVKYEGVNDLKIELNAAALDLAEVVVTAVGEDPAYAILRKIIENKDKNNRFNLDAYSCEVYNKMELDFVNITEGFRNMKLNKPFRFIFDHIDSTSEEEPFLPMFVSEVISDYYYQTNPKKQQEQIKAVKVVGGYDNESVSQLLGIAEAQFNAYDNWIDLVAKKFAGPVANNGTNYYRYYLVDSAYIDNKWCYQIQYFPKHKGINGFYGDFWVHDTTYAIKKMKLQLLDEVHLNFVEKLTINQEYTAVNDSLWMPVKDFITITSTTVTEPLLPPIFKKLRENAPGIQAKRNTTYKDYQFDRSLVEQKVEEEVDLTPNAFEKDDSYWLENRHVALGKSEETAYFLIDTIKNLPIIDVWEKVTTTLFTGYMWGDYVDVGNFYEFLSTNPIEGFRTKFGLRTSTGISKKLMIGGYGAYGWGDQKWKYGADFLYVFNTKPRQTIGGAFLNDYSPVPNLKPNFSLSGEGISTGYFLRRPNIPFKLLEVRHVSLNYFKEWESGFSMKLNLASQRNRPTFNFDYKTNRETPVNQYNFTEASLELRYAFEEVFLSGSYERFSLGSKFPIVSMKYTKGIKGMFDGDLDYHGLELKITDKLRWGAIGYTRIKITGGKIWGKVPYLNMYIPQGNEGFVMNFGGFNTIQEYTFAADRYAFASFDHHFDGFILQLVPFLRKMRLRSVASFRAMIGDMTDENRVANELNLFGNTAEDAQVSIRVPDRAPFMEASVGIENVLRFFRFDAVWRLNYGDIDMPRFGIRGSVHFSL